jgi:putative transposase
LRRCSPWESTVELLLTAGITISMSRQASPQYNAACESFMKSLKQEEVYRTEYRDLNDARRRIGRFLDQVYNQKRLHSALGYLSPAAFERALPTQPATTQNPRPTG